MRRRKTTRWMTFLAPLAWAVWIAGCSGADGDPAPAPLEAGTTPSRGGACALDGGAE